MVVVGTTRGDDDVEAGGALTSRGGKVTNSKVFEPILTVQNLKFHKATRNLVKKVVVEDKMIYNFRFGRNLI